MTSLTSITERLNLRNLKLSQKGLILVSVPLLFEIAFVGVLSWLLSVSETERQREFHAKTIVTQAACLSKSIYDAGSTYFNFIIAKHVGMASELGTVGHLESAIQDMKGELSLLKELAGENLHEQELIRRTNILGLQYINLCEEGKALLQIADHNERADSLSLSTLNQTRDLQRRAKTIINMLMTQLQELTDAEFEVAAVSPEQSKRARLLINQLLVAGVLFNVFLAVALALFYSKEIAQRIGAVTDNSIRLAKGHALQPALAGTDEIAHLDQAFHSMAESMMESSRKERAIVDNAVDVICSINSTGLFTKVNPACKKAWRYEACDLINRDFLDLTFAEERASILEYIDRIKADISADPFEVRMKRGDGTTIDTLWSAHWSEAEQSLFVVVHDISHRKDVERLKQQFLAMVSHDMRTPLTSIHGSLTLLANSALGPLSKQACHTVELAQRNTVRLVNLINDLLDLEKLESGHMQLNFRNASLLAILRSSLESVQVFADDHGVSIECEETSARVYVDENRIEQVLINLLSNAVKFSSAGSLVRISFVPLEGEIEVRIQDTGRGIQENLKQVIFDRFRQVELSDATKKKGTGLGLAICKSIIEQHHGSIGVESEPGRGSTFWFRLSLAAEETDKAASSSLKQAAEL